MRVMILTIVALICGAGPGKSDARFSGLDQSYLAYLGQAPAAEREWFADRFATWRKHFMRQDGSIVDPQNQNITHSEGQAYAMMLAL